MSSILGVLIGAFVITRKSGLGNNRRIRFALSALVFLYAYTSFDYYLSLKIDINSIYSGGSYLLYHLVGPLFLYFILLFTKAPWNFKKRGVLIILYTVIRWGLFLPLIEYETVNDIIASADSYGVWFWIELEYIFSTSINIILLVVGYLKLKNTPLYLKLDKSQSLNYRWIKLLILLFIGLQIASGFNTALNTNSLATLEIYAKIETLILAMFFFVLAFSIMHFPVFAFTGSFEDLPNETKKKYAKSSLSDSSKLFHQIQEAVTGEELYLDYDIKLNTLADKLGKSVHHISQAINENAHMSFSDYINSFRIEAAKPLLLKPKPDTIYSIALDVGFNSKAAFYNAFRKNTEMTPTEFKKNHANPPPS
ncbi:helix-turn-helix domain-containing protein [Flagellimonas sp. HMM57]|uniref:helix-turn-helix domain-containing protein n=1 Tax=unclassified Flagellimonas TaxID=2644544 RepID=UPI001F0B5C23|nr:MULTISPECIES: helix-turn-helix domain-containing protein [unclassified Flagellimonas]UII74779.1 helix-turn-helix domain-containing protein [Flagellimonas sp. HMM57]